MKNLLKRIYDLIIKLISVKGLLFIVFIFLAFLTKTDQTITYLFFSGIACVGLRTAEKYIDVYKKLKG